MATAVSGVAPPIPAIVVALASLLALGCASERAPEPATEQQPVAPLADPVRGRIVDQGIAVELELQALQPGRTGPTAFETARVRFTIQDTATGAPLAGAFPAAWMHRREPDQPPPDADACGTHVKTFIEGSIFAQPEVDLNVFTVLVLNDDASISVVDPRFGFGGSKLLTMIPLAGPGFDWRLADDLATLFVSVPDAGLVTMIETYDYRPITSIEVGEAAKRLILQPDQHYLWAAGGGSLVAIDVDEQRVAATLPIGKALDELAVSADSRWIFASDPTRHEVTVIDTRTLGVHGVVETGWQPVSMDWSTMAGALYVSHRGEGNIAIVDPVGPSVTGTIAAEAGLGQLRFAPGGRFGFVVNPERDLLHVFDSASGRMLQTGEVAPSPDQVTFSNELAYIRHAGSDTIYMMHLDQLGPGLEGKPLQVVDFPAGQSALGPRDTPAASIVRAPGENAMLVAHPIDRAVYYYKEGMAAPMGQFENYRRRARAVLTVDRSLQEVESRGIYETAVRLAEPGTYDVVFFMDAPRVIHCFTIEVADNPEIRREQGPPVRVEWSADEQEPRAHQAMTLVATLSDRDGHPLAQLDDVTFTIDRVAADGRRVTRLAAAQGEGRYQAEFIPAQPGPYSVSVSTLSAGLRVEAGPAYLVLVAASPD